MKNSLNIVLINTSDKGGGAERSVLTLHKALLRLGHRSRLVVGTKLTNEPNVYEIEKLRGIRGLLRLTHWLEKQFGWQYLYAPGFRRLTRDLGGDVDVVNIHGLWGGQGFADVGALPALTRRFPTVITMKESWLTTGHCACPDVVGCERWRTGCGKCPDILAPPAVPKDGTRLNWIRKYFSLRRSTVRFTVPSQWLKERLALSPIVGNNVVEVIPNGVNDVYFSGAEKQEVRARLGLPLDKIIILITGAKLKGHGNGTPHAIEALKKFDRDKIFGLFVGRFSDEAAKELPISTATFPFQDSENELVRFYQAADVTIVPSLSESFGRVAAESQASGTPVVGYATGGLPEVVKNGISGVLVKTGDIQSLYEAIHALIKDKKRMADMGKEAFRWAQSRFTVKAMTEGYLEQYRREILERRGNRV